MRLLDIPDPIRVRAVLASQPCLGTLRVGVMRTEPGEGEPFTRLLLRDDQMARQVTLRAGESVDVPGHGRLNVESVVPSTRERRGWVELALQP